VFFAPHWSIANGLMGLIPGLARYCGARPVDAIVSFVKLLLLLLLGVSLPFAFSAGVEFQLGHFSFHDALFRFFLPIFITDTIWAFTLVPLLMQAARLLIPRIEVRTIMTVYYLLILTVMATWMSSVIVTLEEDIQVEELYTLGAITLIVLIIGLAMSAYSSKKITAPVIRLTDVAHRVADGDYSSVGELKQIIRRPDELGTMATVFSNMVRAVQTREQNLQRQVTTLKIEINRKKQDAELQEITGSDYFKTLKQKAGHLRCQATDNNKETRRSWKMTDRKNR